MSNKCPCTTSKIIVFNRMSLQEALRNFLHGAAMALEEYQVQCSLASFETAMMKAPIQRPTFRYEPPNRDATDKRPDAMRLEMFPKQSDVLVYSAEYISTKPPEWVDDQLVHLATRTKKPLGQCFLKKLRHIFPSMSRPDLTIRLKRLIQAGRIVDPQPTVALPQPEADPEPEPEIQQEPERQQDPMPNEGELVTASLADNEPWHETDAFFES